MASTCSLPARTLPLYVVWPTGHFPGSTAGRAMYGHACRIVAGGLIASGIAISTLPEYARALWGMDKAALNAAVRAGNLFGDPKTRGLIGYLLFGGKHRSPSFVGHVLGKAFPLAAIASGIYSVYDSLANGEGTFDDWNKGIGGATVVAVGSLAVAYRKEIGEWLEWAAEQKDDPVARQEQKHYREMAFRATGLAVQGGNAINDGYEKAVETAEDVGDWANDAASTVGGWASDAASTVEGWFDETSGGDVSAPGPAGPHAPL